jgi:2,3-bisphosphoglycerate-independent phosphoglycerate mutase
VLSALGVGFELEHGDVAIRLNFATIDGAGLVTDRRAGRPSDTENKRLVEKLRAGVAAPGGVRIFFEAEKEHRAVLILRGENISADLEDTDPQETGVPPHPVRGRTAESAASAKTLQTVLDAAFEVLSDEPQANALLARGIDAFHRYPTINDRFGLDGLAIARYPMYRGVARLVGMKAHPIQPSDAESVTALEEQFESYDFHFIHFKAMDSRGEDGDFDAKSRAIAAVDELIPRIEALQPDVMVITGDHSTPAALKAHSWHPVPVMIVSPWTRPQPDATFGERACARGELGIVPARDLMTLALAHAGRLAKNGT